MGDEVVLVRSQQWGLALRSVMGEWDERVCSVKGVEV